MTPKQKAEELWWSYYSTIEHTLSEEYSPHESYIAKQCVLIACNEVINMFSGVHKKLIEIDMLEGNVEETATYKFWQEVKQEIEKL